MGKTDGSNAPLSSEESQDRTVKPSLWLPREKRGTPSRYVDIAPAVRIEWIIGQPGSGMELLVGEIIRDHARTGVYNERLQVHWVTNAEEAREAINEAKGGLTSVEKFETTPRVAHSKGTQLKGHKKGNVVKIPRGIPVPEWKQTKHLIVVDPTTLLSVGEWKNIHGAVLNSLLWDNVGSPEEGGLRRTPADHSNIHVLVAHQLADPEIMQEGSAKSRFFTKPYDVKKHINRWTDEVTGTGKKATRLHEGIRSDDGSDKIVYRYRSPKTKIIDISRFEEEALSDAIDILFGYKNSVTPETVAALLEATNGGKTDQVLEVFKVLESQLVQAGIEPIGIDFGDLPQVYEDLTVPQEQASRLKEIGLKALGLLGVARSTTTSIEREPEDFTGLDAALLSAIDVFNSRGIETAPAVTNEIDPAGR